MHRIARPLRILLAALVGARCGGCGRRGVPTPCSACLSAIRATGPAEGAAFRDEGPLARLVRLAKDGTWRAGGRTFAALVLERAAVPATLDLVTWVPADRGRRSRRGGHLPERTARAIARSLGVPAAPLLQRRARSRPQRGLDRDARSRNVVDAFTAGRRVTSIDDGANVLLVDDVRTTGATMRAASRALLRAHPGLRVHPVAIAGVESGARRRGGAPREPRSERGFSAHDSNHPCRCESNRTRKGPSRLAAPRPP